MTTETGGPAFPTTRGVYGDGMTLRDYFAGIALKETIKQFHILTDELSEYDVFNPYENKFLYAKEAYQWADLMLKARQA